MKLTYIIALVATVSIALTSCEQVMDIHLNETNARYVIEGEVKNGAGPFTVHITRTRNFDQDNSFPGVSQATITILDVEDDVTDHLREQEPGVYQTTQTVGTPGHTYELTVIIDDQVFTAVSVMPSQTVAIDSLYIEAPESSDESSLWDDAGAFVTAAYTDPIGQENYYRLRQWINGTLVEGSVSESDQDSDSQMMAIELDYNIDEGSPYIPLQPGDEVHVELQSISMDTYDYLRTLGDAGVGPGSNPANPISNIQGGALGVFSAAVSDTQRIIVSPELLPN